MVMMEYIIGNKYKCRLHVVSLPCLLEYHTPRHEWKGVVVEEDE